MAEEAKVYLVGAGLGDPDLLTRKAERILQQAQFIIYDRLVGAEILALANPNATCIAMGKQPGRQEEIQSEIYGWFLRLRHESGPIVRLKNGDPMVFGRGGEEIEFLLRHGFEVEVVPGVSSVTTAASLMGLPLTQRGVASSFTVVTGHRQSLETLDWLVYRHIDTLVVLMGVENRALIAASLIAAGRSRGEPIAFLERISTHRQRVIESTLDEVAHGSIEVQAPAVMVIGEVVRLRGKVQHRNSEGRARTSDRQLYAS